MFSLLSTSLFLWLCDIVSLNNLFNIYIFAARGQNIPGLTTSRYSVCFGDFNSFLASCPIRSVIYVQDIQAGANLISNGCPSTNNGSTDPCCMVKNDDCTFKLVGKIIVFCTLI